LQMSHDGDVDGMLPQLEERIRRYVGPGASDYSDFQVALANGDVAAAENILNGGNNPPDDRRGHAWDAMSAIPAGDAQAITRLVLRAVKSRSPRDIEDMRSSCTRPGAEGAPPEPAFGACLIGLAVVGDLDSVFALGDRGYRDIECCTAAEQEKQWLATGGAYYPRWELFGKAMVAARRDPRFIEIARRTGLLAYWKSGHPPDFCAFEQAPVCRLLH
jgi:hypothetical protein